ncbi:MAG: nitroreductase family protein [Candidatus Omnitrophica bacterium]|nr:nitroreductase family protein [Candidatus Omnitrophota bacterium]
MLKKFIKDTFPYPVKLYRNIRIAISILLKTARLSIKEVLSIIKYKNDTKRDKSLLYTFIKKKAHHLELILFFPEEFIHKDKNSLMHNQLKCALQEWRYNNYPNTAAIEWANKILREYEEYIINGSGCPKYKTKGVPENRKRLIDSTELLNLIKRRRSRRTFTDEPLKSEDKELLVEAALWAPSACNRQTLRLIFVEDGQLKKFVAETIPGGAKFFEKAAAIIIIIADKRDYEFPEERVTPFQDSAAAIQNILLLAEARGLGCCWGSYTSYGCIKNEQKIRKVLNIDEYFLITGSIAVGYNEYDVCLVPRDKVEKRYYIDKVSKKD